MRARTLPLTRQRSGGGKPFARKALAVAAVVSLGTGLLAGCADEARGAAARR